MFAASAVALDRAGDNVVQRPDAISADEFAERREAVLNELPQDGVAVFFSAPVYPRYGDIDYAFHQQADMRYLTGATMPGAVLLLSPGGLQIGDEEFDELLLIPDHIAPVQSHAWTSAEGAEEFAGMERVESAEHFETLLTPIIQSDRRIYHLPLPDAVPPASTLGRQLEFFTEHTQLLDLGTSPAVQDAVRSIMEVDRITVFRDLQNYAQEVLGKGSFTTPLGSAMYEAFLEAESLEDWQAWRAEHLDYRYTDATTLRPILDELRMTKSEGELTQLAEAARISATASRYMASYAQPAVGERELQAIADYMFTREGAEPAFKTAIRSGSNALHPDYSANAGTLEQGELVVMELGALYDGYAATLRRTVPVRDSFSPVQRELYEVVASAQDAAIQAVEAGELFREPEQAARSVLSDGLLDLGIIEHPDEVFDYIPDILSHYIGLHVRDVGFGGPLGSGHVLAIAAGVTIPDEAQLDERWRGLSIHLQDVVAVTENGPIVLTDNVPREVNAVEALRQQPFDIEGLPVD